MNMKSQQEIHGAMSSIVCPEGKTPLTFACAAGNVGIVKILLDAGAGIEDHNENGHTPLMEAASAGHVEVAKLLVERGASINTYSNELEKSALTLACNKGHLEMVRFLLETGADHEHKTDEMQIALMEASIYGHVEVARLLLDCGAQVNMPEGDFEPLLTLAALGGYVELTMLLLDWGANIEGVSSLGWTPLMETACHGLKEMVALLLSRGADVNAQGDGSQDTALTLACGGGYLEIADFLIKAGADTELGASTPLMEAALIGHLELVCYLINAGANVNATTKMGSTPLMIACENGHTDVADLLLQACAKLEHETEEGRTPLMKASRFGHLCTVQFLISKGANVNKQTSNNDHTPLSLACAGGHLAVAKLLLANGADPMHKLKGNSTILIEAAKRGRVAVVQMLLDYPSVVTSPPPPDLSQIPTSGLENNEAPPHGRQVFHPPEAETNASSNNSYLASVQAVPHIQDLRESLPTPPQAVPEQKTVQRNTVVENNEAPSSSVFKSSHSYHYRSKSNAAAQANSLYIQAETSEFLGENKLELNERLEQCFNILKEDEMLNPSPEEQKLAQRYKPGFRVTAYAQLLLKVQQRPKMHMLGTIFRKPSTLTALRSTSANSFTSVPDGQLSQQLLINARTSSAFF